MSPSAPSLARRRTRAAVASILGTTIEWYDFFLYGAVAALVFNQLFFTDLDPIAGTMAAFATFAVGFVVRPFGAAFFGHLGDRKGRKHALLVTLVLMGVATVGIGLLPAYDTIGLLAPFLLMVLRMLQGFAAGGEWGGAVLFTFENSAGLRRGLMAALPGMGIGLGSLLSTGTVAVLTATLSDEQFLQWGWRVPFLASAVIVLVGVYVRLAVSETVEFEEVQRAPQAQAKAPVRSLVREQWRELLIVVGARLGENGGYYLMATFAVAYAAQQGIEVPVLLASISIAFGLQIAAIPFFGWLSDLWGRRLVYGAGAALLAVWGWVFFALLDTDRAPFIFIAVFVGIVVAHSAMFGAQSAFFAELFDVRVRYTGVALGHSLGAIVGGGIAPMVAAALLAARGGDPLLVSVYASLLGVVTVITLAVSRRLLAQGARRAGAARAAGEEVPRG